MRERERERESKSTPVDVANDGDWGLDLYDIRLVDQLILHALTELSNRCLAQWFAPQQLLDTLVQLGQLRRGHGSRRSLK